MGAPKKLKEKAADLGDVTYKPGDFRQADLLRKTASDAFFDELEKLSAPTMVRAWRDAMASGDTAHADQIASAYGKLDLKPRYLKDISGGGAEAGVDLMMGKDAPSGHGGLMARKLYKPDSFIAQGHDMANIVAEKKRMTDYARNLSPEARSVVPDMYSHNTTVHPNGEIRTQSMHEYVPNARTLDRSGEGRRLSARNYNDISFAKQHVIDPMAAAGMPMGDTANLINGRGAGNLSNIARTPSGPKILDFIPASGDTHRVVPYREGSYSDAVLVSSGGPHASSYVGDASLRDLRKEHFNPTDNYDPVAESRKVRGIDMKAKTQPIDKTVANTTSPTVPSSGSPTLRNAPNQASTPYTLGPSVGPSSTTVRTPSVSATVGKTTPPAVSTVRSKVVSGVVPRIPSVRAPSLPRIGAMR